MSKQVHQVTTDQQFSVALQNHLLKSELEFRASYFPQGSEVEWLEPYCDTTQSISRFLRSIGFRIKEIMDDEEYHWVVTTNWIVVHANSEHVHGLVARAAK